MSPAGLRLPTRCGVSTRQRARVYLTGLEGTTVWLSNVHILIPYRRLEELEKEIQHLRSSVSTHPPAAAPQSLQGILLTPSESYHAEASSIVGQESSGSRVDLVASQVPSLSVVPTTPVHSLSSQPPSQPSPLLSDTASPTLSRSLDFVHLHGHQVNALFNM